MASDKCLQAKINEAIVICHAVRYERHLWNERIIYETTIRLMDLESELLVHHAKLPWGLELLMSDSLELLGIGSTECEIRMPDGR